VALLGQWNGAMLTTAPVGLAEDPVTTPREWKASFFVAPALLNNPLISGWNADPDGDGLENLIEIAVGAHPLLPNPQQEGLPVGSTVSAANGVAPVLRFQKRPELLLEYGVAANEGSTIILRNDLREIVGQGEGLLKNKVLSTLSLTVILDATD
jgi:hypothetical protein